MPQEMFIGFRRSTLVDPPNPNILYNLARFSIASNGVCTLHTIYDKRHKDTSSQLNVITGALSDDGTSLYLGYEWATDTSGIDRRNAVTLDLETGWGTGDGGYLDDPYCRRTKKIVLLADGGLASGGYYARSVYDANGDIQWFEDNNRGSWLDVMPSGSLLYGNYKTPVPGYYNNLYILNRTTGAVEWGFPTSPVDYWPNHGGVWVHADPDGLHVYYISSTYNTITNIIVKVRISDQARVWVADGANIQRGLFTKAGRLYVSAWPAHGSYDVPYSLTELDPSDGSFIRGWDVTTSNVTPVRLQEDSYGHIIACGYNDYVDDDGNYGSIRVFDADLNLLHLNDEMNTSAGGGNFVFAECAILSAVVPISIDDQSVSQVAYNDTPLVLFVTASGTGPLTYRWKKDESPLVGETADTLTIPIPVTGTAGMYVCTVSNAFEDLDSDDIDIVVSPYIVIQPSPSTVTIRAGNSFELSVLAGGGPDLGYQWKLNDVAIVGATTAEYSTTHILESASGNYTCTVYLLSVPEEYVDTDPVAVTVLPSLSGLHQRMFDIPLDNDRT